MSKKNRDRNKQPQVAVVPVVAAPAVDPLQCRAKGCTHRRAARSTGQLAALCGHCMGYLPPLLALRLLEPVLGATLDRVAVQGVQTVLEVGAYPCFDCGINLDAFVSLPCNVRHQRHRDEGRWLLWCGNAPGTFLCSTAAPFAWQLNPHVAHPFTRAAAGDLLLRNWPNMDRLFAAVPAALLVS